MEACLAAWLPLGDNTSGRKKEKKQASRHEDGEDGEDEYVINLKASRKRRVRAVTTIDRSFA